MKLMAYDGAVRYSKAYGVPGWFPPAAIALEPGGGPLIVGGLFTSVMAFLPAGFRMVTAIIFPTRSGEPGQVLHFEMNPSIAGGFLILCVRDAGPWCLDRVLDASRHQRLHAR